jgi:hypothetical protein
LILAGVLRTAAEPARTAEPEESKESATRLGVKRTAFTLNGKPTFLYGISYYGGLGASEETLKRDLTDIKKQGFNWIRVWATWAAFENDVSAVDADGKPPGEVPEESAATGGRLRPAGGRRRRDAVAR